ncbi:MAG: hypothetical protein K0Q97_1548 [Bacillota bacterium]|nr:hypothetical protein [Bacillota bacterium]
MIKLSKVDLVDFIIVISMICIFFSGFVFINKLSAIVNPNEFNDAASQKPLHLISERALIIGNISIINEIVTVLKKRNISAEIIQDMYQLEITDPFDYLIAVSENDLDNLMICSICKKFMGINQDIAICNLIYNTKIYEDNQIPYLLKENLTADLIVSSLLNSYRI